MQQDWKLSGNITDKLLYCSLLYIAAIMPIQGPAIPLVPGIVLMVIAWLFSGGLISKLRVFAATKKTVMLVSLYLLYCIGFFYSANHNYALTDLFLKLPLLLFPLIISSSIIKAKRDTLLKVFLFSCLLSALFCLGRAAYLTHTTGVNYFFYSLLSYFMHVGHYAMYITLAACVSAYFSFKAENTGAKIAYAITSFVLAATVFLLSARAQFAAFIIILYAGIIIYFFSQKKWLQGTLVLITSLLLFMGALFLSPGVKTRITSVKNEASVFLSGNKTQYNSVSLRFMLWETGYEVIRQHPLFGEGTGDAKDKLMEEAGKKGYAVIVEKNLNYHNQYMQTMAAIGFPGLVALLGAIIYGFIYGIKKNDYLCLSFLTIIVTSFLTESVLERQTGVIYYAFFSALFMLANYDRKNAAVS